MGTTGFQENDWRVRVGASGCGCAAECLLPAVVILIDPCDPFDANSEVLLTIFITKELNMSAASDAKRMFVENLNLFGNEQSQPEKYNLYLGLIYLGPVNTYFAPATATDFIHHEA
jgi:hypothetical protein